MSKSTHTDGGDRRLDWPEGFARHGKAERRSCSKFEVTMNRAIQDLETEMERLDVDDWRLETTLDHQRKNPNYPYASQPKADDPGVVLRWQTDDDRFAVACDRWTRVRDNIREIGLYVQEKRKMEGRPVETGQSEWATARLPPADQDDVVVAGASDQGLDREPHEVLGVSPDAEPAVVRGAYRELVKAAHNDQGGRDDLDVQELRDARDALLE